MDSKNIEDIIKRVVGEYISGGKISTNASGVMKKSFTNIERVRFDTGNANDKVYVTDLFSLEESPRIGCGLMELDNSSFNWTLNYDEMDIVLEGTLTVKLMDGSEVSAKSGEVLFIPKGSSIVFHTPNYAKFVYVVYPANWQEQ